jgi:hypothetical protein
MPRARRIPEAGIERDVEDEITFHLESRVAELIARGQPEETARQYAQAEFGDLGAARRELAAVDRHRRRRECVSGSLRDRAGFGGAFAPPIARTTLAAVLTLSSGWTASRLRS